MKASTLLVGYKAADLTAASLAGDVTCHVLDIYHRHAIEKTFPSARVVCDAHLPKTAADGSPWQVVRFRCGPKLLSGELTLDLLQEAAAVCGGAPAIVTGPGTKAGALPRIELDYVGRERDLNDLVDKIVRDPKRVRSFRAEWPASVPGGPVLKFISTPGCFCHRRLDEGGLALAEVVSRELREGGSSGRCELLDMGCGCGLVGFLVRSVAPNVSLTMIDSHSRAVEAARENAERLGMPATVAMADDGIASLTTLASGVSSEGAFDIFVGNPPYYSDYRIADVFLETAKRALKPGGTCYTVCKNAAGLEPVQRRYFDSVEVVRRRGYSVLKSIR